MQEERAALQRMIDGYRLSQVLFVAAELRVADRLGNEPMTVDALARATETDADALGRLLRALMSVGIVKDLGDGRFALAPPGRLLQQRVEGSVHAWARLNASLYRPWGDLMRSIRTGAPAFDGMHGKNRWQHLASSAAGSRVFNEAMAEGSLQVARALLAACDLSPFRSFVDVGGGDGVLMEALLCACPQASGIVLDLHEAIRDARPRIDGAGLSARCLLTEGSFFDSVPAGGDAYFLSRVLHDWNDECAQAILQNTRRAMAQGARLFLIERLVATERPSLESTLSDLSMMVMNGGRERTRDEFERLLSSAGFRIGNVVATPIVFQIIVAETI